MGHAHIVVIDEVGLDELRQVGDADAQALELGRKVIALCGAFEDPIDRYRDAPARDGGRAVSEPTIASIGSCVGAIHWVGFPGSDRDEVFYWGAGLKPIQQATIEQLLWIQRAVQREIEARQG